MQKDRRDTLTAITLFVIVLFGNAVIFTIVPYLTIPSYGFGYSPFQIMLCYGAIATGCMMPWAMKQGKKLRRPKQMKLYGFRALLEYGSFTLSFFALGYLGDLFTLPMHTSLNFMTPLLATIIAIFVLKEKSHVHTWLALGIGFLGVLIITRPGMIPMSPGVMYVLGAAAGFSATGIVIKLLTRTESAHHIAFYMLAMTTLLALPAGIAHWKMPNLEGWFWLCAIGIIAYLQQIWIARAISKVPYMVLIPLNFVQLLFTSSLSYIVYGKLIDGWILLGALAILAATLYNAWQNTVQAAKILKENKGR